MFQTLVDGRRGASSLRQRARTRHMIPGESDLDSELMGREAVSHYFFAINIVPLPTRHFHQDTPDRAPVTMKLKALNACPLAAQIDITEA